MSRLFEPITLGRLTLRNRLWIAPMCQYSVELEDGVPTEWHLQHLASLAAGRPGLLITEAAAVSPEGRISPQDAGIWNDEQVASWAPIVHAVHGMDTRIGIQLAHAGRKGSTYRPWEQQRGSMPPSAGGWLTVAPSALAFLGYEQPLALDDAGIERVITDFADGARRAVAAGFDVVEIHAAHGYLLHQFLSPLSNTRTDAWGGPLTNRARLLLDVVRAIRGVAAEVPIIVRFSGTDWLPGGLTIEEVVQVAGWARDAGADCFDLSSGGNAPARIPLGPGYQVSLATAVHAAGLQAAAVGLITSSEQAEQIVASGAADAVLIARAALRNPHAPLVWAEELGESPEWPPQYERSSAARTRLT